MHTLHSTISVVVELSEQPERKETPAIGVLQG
jgi:hypothetical protein